jgi:CheY-like chemotaxis protein
MYQSKKITIAIADDHAMLRKGIINLLSLQGKIVSLFDVDSGNEVLEYLKKHIIPPRTHIQNRIVKAHKI